MSTSMLEQALIDAEELREAAIKNAEQAIIEKYSIDIKKAVEVILEQEDELGKLPTDDPEAPEESNFQKEVPAAHTDDEELCACPDEDEEVEIDFDELAKRLDTEEEKMEAEDMTDREDFGDETLELQEDVLKEILEEIEDLDEEIEITEEALETLKEEDTVEESTEELKEKEVDEGMRSDRMTQQKTMLNKYKKQSAEEPQTEPAGLPTSRSDRKATQAAMLDKYKKQMAESRRRNKKLNKQLREVVTEHKEIKKLALKLKDKLNEINLSNLKLHYTNRILTSDSLNERQKNKIVEAIKRAVSAEETKTIFDTLQSAVGDASAKVAPKSLNEVVSRRSSAFLPRKERPSKKDDSFAARMKTLAGIKE